MLYTNRGLLIPRGICMSDFIAEKYFCLSRAFPQYAAEMLFLMRAFDGFYQKPVQDIRDLQDYILGFAVYSNLEIAQNVMVGLDKRVTELIKQGRILTAGEIERKYNIKNAKFLLHEYDSALRISTPTGTKTYLTRDKESDFLFWVKNQSDALLRQKDKDITRVWKYQRAIKDMVTTPIVKVPTVRKSPDKPDVWAITDAEMHEIATRLARRRNVKDPDIVLNDMVVAIVRKNMKQQ